MLHACVQRFDVTKNLEKFGVLVGEQTHPWGTPSPGVTWAGLSLGLAMGAFNTRRCRLGIAPSDFSMPISTSLSL